MSRLERGAEHVGRTDCTDSIAVEPRSAPGAAEREIKWFPR